MIKSQNHRTIDFVKRLCILWLIIKWIQAEEIHTPLLCSTKHHLHLSTDRNASNSIIISFSSQPCDIYDEEGLGAVLIGTHPDQLDLVIGNDIRRYQANIYHSKNYVEQYISDRQHHVLVTNLTPSTKYYYKCVVIVSNPMETANIQHHDDNWEEQEESESKRHLRNVKKSYFSEHEHALKAFTTSSIPCLNVRARFAVLGDLGVSPWQPHSTKTIATLSDGYWKKNALDFIVMVGDLSYANGDHHKWDVFMNSLPEDMMGSIPLYVIPGNHDVEGDPETGEIYTAFEDRFRMPHVKAAEKGKATKKKDYDLNKMYQLPYEYGNSYYSFVFGPSFNIALNAFADFEPGSTQYQWLLKELQNVDRSITPWLVVFVHCPLYNTFSFHRDDPQPRKLKEYLEPIFVEYSVNFVFSGHLHGYSRSYNIANDTLTSRGPIHFVLGNGGRTLNAPFHEKEKENWVAVRDHTTYGFGVMEYMNATMAKYEWIHSGWNAPEESDFDDIPANFTDLMYFPNQYMVR